ncbi:MAG: hypothetical protein ACYTFD_13520 [Planctomycetota bacterium]|jgi:hemolysin III
MPDGGPIYCETDPTAWLVEPWGTISELAFLLVIVVWVRRLRGRWREHPFVAFALPVMFVGFVGGVLFHGLRSHRLFFLMDVIPMLVLIFATLGYLAYRLTRRWWAALLYTALLYTLHEAVFRTVAHRNTAIAVSYLLVGLGMALPVLLEVLRHRGRGLRDVLIMLGFLVLGTTLYQLDDDLCDVLPMGTLGFWHLCAAAAIHFLIRFLVAPPPVRSRAEAR